MRQGAGAPSSPHFRLISVNSSAGFPFSSTLQYLRPSGYEPFQFLMPLKYRRVKIHKGGKREMKRTGIIALAVVVVLLYTIIASAGCLTVNSPNGGESWVLGSVHNITWTNTCNKSVKIVLRKGSVKIGNIITNIPVSQTSYSWTVGTYQGGTAVTGTDYKILIKTMDGSSMDASNGNFSITSGSPGQCAPLSITSQNTLTDGFVNQSYNYQIQTSGGQAPVTFQKVSGSLPPGINLNSAGVISGTPTATGTYTFTVKVTDSCPSGAQTVQKTFSLTINPEPQQCQPLSITSPANMPDAMVNQAYSYQIQTSGGQAPITFTMVSGSMPQGLTLNNSTGAVTGTPTKFGTYTFTVKVTDSCPSGAQTVQKTFSLTINPEPQQCQPLSITSPANMPDAMVNQAYSYQIQTSGGQAPITFTMVSGSMPQGLTLNNSTGAVTGTPTKFGTYTFTVQVTDSCPSGAQTVQKEFILSVKIKMVVPKKPLKPFKPLAIKCAGKTATIVGTTGNDVIQGTQGDDVIAGLGGNDKILGLGGNDTICGGDGNDEIYGNTGNDYIYGNNGNDNLHGGPGSDNLIGGNGIDYLYGESGKDTLFGGSGNDVLFGGSDSDVLFGDQGDDHLYGGDGYDACNGGSGNDLVPMNDCEGTLEIP